jgi:hypothetical protein
MQGRSAGLVATLSFLKRAGFEGRQVRPSKDQEWAVEAVAEETRMWPERLKGQASESVAASSDSANPPTIVANSRKSSR